MTGKKSEHPNVIVFFTDQQRWDTAGVHGNPLELMPNFDRMARRGTHVAASFTCQPVCGPARSALQTGRYPTTTGCYRNGIPLPADARTLGHHFRNAGYQTGYIGKWHLADEEPVPDSKRAGYEYWLASNVLEFTSDAYRTVVYDNDNQEVHLPGYRVDALTDAAIRFITASTRSPETGDRPFYLFLSFLEPHQQNHRDDYPAPEGYAERYAGRWVPSDLAALGGSTHQHLGGYFGMVKRLDEALGRLQDALISLELRENTVLLFTSDHGCHFKTRNDEYKRSCHDSSIRVPTALQGPGFEGGGQLRPLVSLIDLPPTLLDAAGLPVPPEMQGRSFLPLVKGQTDGLVADDSSPSVVKTRRELWPTELFVQISEAQVGRAVRTHRWKYGVDAPDKNPLRDPGSDRYVEEYLYDLMADPHELTNLIGFESHQEVAGIMRERLIRRMVEAGEAAPAIDLAPPKRSGQRRVSSAEARA